MYQLSLKNISRSGISGLHTFERILVYADLLPPNMVRPIQHSYLLDMRESFSRHAHQQIIILFILCFYNKTVISGCCFHYFFDYSYSGIFL